MHYKCSILNILVRIFLVILIYSDDRIPVNGLDIDPKVALTIKHDVDVLGRTLRNYAGHNTDVYTLHNLFNSSFNRINKSSDPLDSRLAEYISTELNGDLYKEINFHDVHRVFHDIVREPTDASVTTSYKNVTMVTKKTHAFLYSFLLRMNGISKKCCDDMGVVILNILNRTQWTQRLLDTMGHIESGILGGNYQMLGNYDECIHVRHVVKKNEVFHGKYCTFVLPVVINVKVGTCVPSTCSEQDVKKLYKNENEEPKADVSCVEDNPLPPEAIACICVLVVLLMIIIVGTIHDFYPGNPGCERLTKNTSNQTSVPNPLNEENEVTAVTNSVPEGGDNKEKNTGVDSKPEDDHRLSVKGKLSMIVNSFSVYSNLREIFIVSNNENPLSAINGIRFLSISWIMLGHSFVYTYRQSDNIIQYGRREMMNSLLFMVVPSTELAVDVFFTISGLLVSYFTLKELQKVGGAKRFNWAIFYIHRYMRLTPTYALVIMVTVCLLVNVMNGPLWYIDNAFYLGDCKKRWWRNLLYIDNFFHGSGCIQWTWYLSNDMQMFWISPLMIIPLFYNTVFGILTCGAMFAASSIAAGVFSYTNDFTAQHYGIAAISKYNKWWQHLYTASYIRIGPYIIGVLTGFLLYKTDMKIKLPKMVNILCWIICLGISGTIVYSIYPDNNNHIFNVHESAAYHALARSGIGLCASWIMFACATNHGGWINRLLSWKCITPLGRLTYCTYLVHPLIISAYSMTRTSEIHYTTFDFMYLFIGNLILSYVTALVASLLFEVPSRRLEKVFMS